MVQTRVTLHCHSRMLLAGIQPNAPVDSRQKHAGMTPHTSATRSKMFLNHARFGLVRSMTFRWEKGRGGLLIQAELGPIKGSEGSARMDQFREVSPFDDLSRAQDQNHVGFSDGGETVSNDESCAPHHQLA